MISKLHGFLVFVLFGVIAGSVATGVVLSSRGEETSSTFIDSPPDFVVPVWNNITDTNTTDDVNVPIWWDEFEGTELNRDHWRVMTGGDGWGNREEQVYVDSPTSLDVADSQLVITASKGEDGKYTSARIMTNGAWYPGMTLPNGKTTKKIRFESVITLPEAGQGIWPAFWAYPEANTYGDFPGSGEIDIMEIINAQDKLIQGIHYGSVEHRTMNMTRTPALDGTFALGTYKFAVDWYADKMTFFLNDEAVNTYYSKNVHKDGWFTDFPGAGPNAPFDKGFNLILNIAVGGNWPKSPDSTTPQTVNMLVDYVRVYADF
ncbi:(1-3)-beta-glucanase [Acanthocystis turfacea Chlorella virus WI0606]|nr:(1-3)-beta-glucanase [Acanthocystis turfacea Chlorella virus WI0606]